MKKLEKRIVEAYNILLDIEAEASKELNEGMFEAAYSVLGAFKLLENALDTIEALKEDE